MIDVSSISRPLSKDRFINPTYLIGIHVSGEAVELYFDKSFEASNLMIGLNHVQMSVKHIHAQDNQD